MTAATAEVVTPPGAEARPRAEVLRLADGVELIGEIEGSGLRKPPLLARRSDGQMVQLTKLLFAIAALSDGRRDAQTVAEILTRASNRRFAAADVLLLVEKRLRPVGVLALADGTSPQVPKRQALMALRHRRPLLSERVVNVLAWPFTWLHRPIVTFGLLLALIAFDVWLFTVHGLGGALRAALYNPELLLAVLASVVVATAFHELGHASACRYSGARPGVMGVGFYLVYPAFYCEVTDAYRLNRAGRLRTDLGGVYFNGVFALLAGAVFFATGQEAALLVAAVQHLILLQQLLPLMRFDGYYVLTDLTGVPDILSRIKPIFRSLVRGRDREPQVAELKPWVRVAVTAYLVALVPTFFLLFAAMVLNAPRIIATVHDSFGLQLERVRAAEGLAEAGTAAVGILALVLPVAAMALSISSVCRMGGRGLVRWSRGSTSRTVAAVVAAAAVVGAVAYAWWPDGDYEPIRPGERGTVGELLTKLPVDEFTSMLGSAVGSPAQLANGVDLSLVGSNEPGTTTGPTRATTEPSPTPSESPTTTTTEPSPTPSESPTTTTTEPSPTPSESPTTATTGTVTTTPAQ